MKGFDYIRATTLEEAIDVLAKCPETKVLVGGTDLLIRLKEGRIQPPTVLDLKGIPGLREIQMTPDGLSIGAATPLVSLIHHPQVMRDYPMLAEACHTIGSVQIRNRASIGGNLCNASPLADSAPALLAYGAKLEILSKQGLRTVPVEEFFRGPGQTVLAQGEILTRILLPVPPAGQGTYIKHARRKAVDLASVGVAVFGWTEQGKRKCRIALGAVAPTPIRATEAEKIIEGGGSFEEAAQAARDASRPISDLRSSKEYREEMISVHVRRALEHVFSQDSGQ